MPRAEGVTVAPSAAGSDESLIGFGGLAARFVRISFDSSSMDRRPQKTRSQPRPEFDEFTKLPDGKPLNPKGTGLGLAVSRRLVELMQGYVSAAGNPGGGTAFTFTLPVPA